jgi:hypothetical protein
MSNELSPVYVLVLQAAAIETTWILAKMRYAPSEVTLEDYGRIWMDFVPEPDCEDEE